MIQRNTTIVLGIVAVLLSVWTFVFESRFLTSSELGQRQNRVVQSFVRSRVTEIRLTRGQSTIALHRDRAEDLDNFEVGAWSLTAPIRVAADSDAVDQLLSALEWLEAKRTLESTSATDRQNFGLETPQASAHFVVASREVEVRIGGEDPRGEGLFASSSDRPERVFVVGRDILEAFQHGVDHFRKKELFSDFSALAARSFELDAGEVHVEGRKEGLRWLLSHPEVALARKATIDELLGALVSARATRFLSGVEAPSDRAPSADLQVATEAHDDAAAGSVRLRLYGACPDHPSERLAVVGEQSEALCVAADDVDALEFPTSRFFETRLLTLRDDEVDRIEITGAHAFSLVRKESGFELEDGGRSAAADRTAIADWTRSLRALDGYVFEPANDRARTSHGLGAGSRRITLRAADGERTEAIVVGTPDPEGVWVEREGDPRLAKFPPSAVELLTASRERFRDRALLHETEGRLQRLRIARNGQTEELERQDGEYRINRPFEARADRVVARDVVRALSSLSALRFEAPSVPSRVSGLETPRLIVEAHFEGTNGSSDHDDHAHPVEASDAPSRDITLRIGAATEGGAFASLEGDNAVFVVAESLVRDLSTPLVSRDALAVESSEIEQLTLTRGTSENILARSGDEWTFDGAAVDQAKVTLLLDRLGSLRAIGATHYGAARPDEMFARPLAVLEVQRRRGTPERQTIRIAAAPGAEGKYFARRDDLEVTYEISRELAELVRDFAP